MTPAGTHDDHEAARTIVAALRASASREQGPHPDADVRASPDWIAREQAIFDRLVDQLTDKDSVYSLAAAEGLSTLDVDRLEDRLDLSSAICPIVRGHAHARVRAAAARALGHYVVRDRRVRRAVLKTLSSALGDRDPDVRLAAASALGRLRPVGRAVLEALGRACDDSHKGVRTLAAAALKYIEERTLGWLAVRDLALSTASGAGALAAEGTALDGRLAWAVAESDESVEIYFSSEDPSLDGVVLRLRVGVWVRDILLAMVSSGAVEGFLTIPAAERRSLSPGEVSIELVDPGDGADA